MIELIVFFSLIFFMCFQAWYFRISERTERDKHNDKLNKIEEYHKEERQDWAIERQQLLDRIQSPSFAEYKHQEVKVIKAQNNVPEPPKLEVL